MKRKQFLEALKGLPFTLQKDFTISMMDKYSQINLSKISLINLKTDLISFLEKKYSSRMELLIPLQQMLTHLI